MVVKDNGTATKTRWYFGNCEREQVGSTLNQYIWIGGDAYSAVAVAKKAGSGSFTVYSIFRDHLGTITHLRNSNTGLVDEYSFDAWGRRRDKDNWSYTMSGDPDLFADRGFTAHEFLPDFNLYNMNGRLYDPVVGRFLSPDPYISDPSFSQSYNRYAYCLNNPLKYSDPSGELPSWALWPTAWLGNWLIGGMDRWVNKKESFKQAFSFKNNPVVVSANYSPSANQFSNPQVDAQKAAKQEMYVSQELERFIIQQRINAKNAANNGTQTNWGLYVTGAVLTTEDVYNNFYHNHKTYTTLAGEVKDIYKANGAVRSARAAQFARASTTVKAFGTAGTALMTGVAIYNIRNGNGTAWDYSDATVGTIGLVGAGASVAGYAIPVVGEGVAAYSWFRLWYDLGTKYGPSSWYGPDNTKWFK